MLPFRLRILDTPLERDEGEFAYGGQLIRQGEIPYTHLYNIKFPGTYAAYAIIMTVFGETPAGIHFGLLLVNVASIVLVFVLGKKLHSAAAGALACALFGVITLSPDILGFAAHATHFVTFCALAGFYFLLRAFERQRLADAICCGALMGCALLCKQPGVFFGVMALVLLYANEVLRRRPIVLAAYVIAWMAPLLMVCVLMLVTGHFDLFYRWTLKYAIGHSIALTAAFTSFKESWNQLSVTTHALSYMAAAAFVFIACNRRIAQPTRHFVLAFVVAGIASVVPGFSFYQHYFLLPAGAVALCIAIASMELVQLLKMRSSLRALSWTPLAVGPLWIFYVIFTLRIYFFAIPAEHLIAQKYFGNPFVQSRVVGEYIADHCSRDGTIAILHSEPEILFYAHRKSATGYIYAYDMTSYNKYHSELQTAFQKELLASQPEYVVYVHNPYSWAVQDDRGSEFVRWCWGFPRNGYQLVGIVDGVNQQATFKWDAEAATYTHRSDSYIEVFRRNDSRPTPLATRE